MKPSISKRRYFLVVAYSVAGFFIALAVNVLVPQVSKNVVFNEYTALGLTLDMNSAFRLTVVLLALVYAGIGVLSYKDPKHRARFAERAAFRFAVGIALALWDVLGTKLLLLPQPFFPGPARIIESFLMEGGYIFQNTLYSVRLFTAGFLLGAFLGISTGILIGWFPKVYYWVYPVLKTTGIIPAVVWMPFALTIFPTPFIGAAFLIAICVWFPVASMTAAGISSTPKMYFEVARTFGAKTPYLVFRVAIPHAMPHIFTGITTANAFAFAMLVMAEMMGQPGGLGYYINASNIWSSYYKVFAAIIVMAVMFSLIMFATDKIKKHTLRWQKGLLKS